MYFADDAESKLINLVDTADDTQKVFFASDSSKLDASKETANLILVGGIDSTILGGKGKISIGAAASNVVLKNSGDVIVQLGDDWLMLEDAQAKSFQINDFTALVDKNISYDEAANYFLSTSKNASVIVSEEAEVWLDGSHGKNFVGNIKTLDASTSNGQNTLAGNDLDNVICAGTGDASLWGGKGNDLLIGGKAHNLFFYTSGNDTIQSANDSDAVILSNVTLEQISSTSITLCRNK